MAAAGHPGAVVAAGDGIRWQGWTETLFTQAQQENRLVLLDLEAVWCHWCHVMDKMTYQDPRVVAIIERGYLPVKVDQDSRPDLANRYEDYGWPATILFSPGGEELAKLSGYIPPERMASLLQAFLDDPRPGPSVTARRTMDYASGGVLSADLPSELERIHFDHYDPEYGSWGRIHKFLHGDSVEYAMELAAEGDVRSREMARKTLDANLKLMDPVWGGVYQYSDSGVWDNPHFEKIMSFQTTNLRLYALAYARWREARYLATALDIKRYLLGFLGSPEGAFYTSQDADVIQGEHSSAYFSLGDEERRKRGVPRVDTHVYARENGWVIEALAVLHDVTSDPAHLQDAVRAAERILSERSLPGGGFRHDLVDAAGPYLGDTLAMGRAFLALYTSTAERVWLDRAQEAARFIESRFRAERDGAPLPGFVTAVAGPGSGYQPQPQRDENIQALRFLNLLFHYTGREEHRKGAEHAMRYLAAPEVARRRPTGGILLAARELDGDPAHITIVGSKDHPLAGELFRAALRYPSGYRRVEWWDRAEGPLPNPDVEYPALDEPAAFACAAHRCSRPIRDPDRIVEVVSSFKKSSGN
jgi:hypothetical protein